MKFLMNFQHLFVASFISGYYQHKCSHTNGGEWNGVIRRGNTLGYTTRTTRTVSPSFLCAQSEDSKEAAAAEAERFFDAFGVSKEKRPGYTPPIQKKNCQCGSGLTYGDCCYPYHSAQVLNSGGYICSLG